MNNKGKLVSSSVTTLYSSMDVFIHQEDSPIYVCVMTNTTKKINVELVPNLALPEMQSFPTADDAGQLQRELFVLNSKLMELINQQAEFERNEHIGLEVGFQV